MEAASSADTIRRAPERVHFSRGGFALGEEPALDIGDRRTAPPDRRAVSLRWLAGTVLTGVASTALMGGALYASLDSQARFAHPPQPLGLVQSAAAAPGAPLADTKSDRLTISPPRFSSRQIMRLDTITHVGEREFIKVKPYARVSASLSLNRTELTEDLKPFNPLSMFHEDGEKADSASDDSAAPRREDEVEGDVSLVLRPFDENVLGSQEAGPVAHIPEEEIDALVKEASVKGTGETVVMTPHASSGDVFDMGFNAFAFGPREMDSFADLVTRAYAENVTEIARTTAPVARLEGALAPDERMLVVGPDDEFVDLLRRNGASAEEADHIAEVMREQFSPEDLSEGQRLRLNVSASEGDQSRVRPVRVSVYDANSHRVTVALSDNDEFVAIDDPGDLASEPAPSRSAPSGGSAPSLYASLYETALHNDVPRDLVDEVVQAFSYDVDFHRRVKAGESFEVFYALDDDGSTAGGEVLYAALTLDGERKRLYRFASPEDGEVDFYDDEGRSARKFLMRKPVAAGTMRSGFGMRRHPILGYSRMHTGVDYSAPRGTPIVAAGNGTVDKAQWHSGYGRYVRVRHANGYQTAYAHMSEIASGISPGTRVSQGQVIGYVGSTGMSTGNHLHYEVLVDGRFVNPMNIRVPRGRELEGEVLEAFHTERERIDAVMNRSPAASQIAIAP